jgi:hypothetical protein
MANIYAEDGTVQVFVDQNTGELKTVARNPANAMLGATLQTTGSLYDTDAQAAISAAKNGVTSFTWRVSSTGQVCVVAGGSDVWCSQALGTSGPVVATSDGNLCVGAACLF